MSDSITLEDIYKLFEKTNEQLQQSRQEFDRRMAESKAESEHRAAENERLIAESKAESEHRIAEIKAETNRLIAESKAETERLIAESKAESERRATESERRIAEIKAETERLMAEAKTENALVIAELRKIVERTTQAVDSLTTRWGRFVEELVEPAAIKLFRERGIEVEHTFSRGKIKKQGVAMEIDILAVDDTELVAIECKSRLSKDDVDYFLEKLKRFKQAFPHFQTFEVYGAVAGIEIDEGIDRYAYKKGLFVIKPSGDTVEIVNNDQFQGRKW